MTFIYKENRQQGRPHLLTEHFNFKYTELRVETFASAHNAICIIDHLPTGIRVIGVDSLNTRSELGARRAAMGKLKQRYREHEGITVQFPIPLITNLDVPLTDDQWEAVAAYRLITPAWQEPGFVVEAPFANIAIRWFNRENGYLRDTVAKKRAPRDKRK